MRLPKRVNREQTTQEKQREEKKIDNAVIFEVLKKQRGHNSFFECDPSVKLQNKT